MAFFNQRSRLRPVLMGAIALVLAGFVVVQAQPSKEIRAQLDTTRLELTQIEAALQRETLDEKRLLDLKERLQPLLLQANDLLLREQPRADEIRARLEKLGPAPDASKGQSESAEAARERSDEQKLMQEADETLRLLRAITLRAEQAQQAIADRRRDNFTRQILEQSSSIASPVLWLNVVNALPQDVRAFRFLTEQWLTTIIENLDWHEAVILLVFAGLIMFGLKRGRRWVRTGHLTVLAPEPDADWAPTRLTKALFALRLFMLNTVAPVTLCLLTYHMTRTFELLPGRADQVMRTFLMGVAFIAFMNGLLTGVFSPHRAHLRLVPVTGRVAREVGRCVRLLTVVIASGKVLEAINQAIVATLPTTILTKGIIAIVVGLVMARGLHRAFGIEPEDRKPEGIDTQNQDEEPVHQKGALPFRLAAWLAVVGILGSVVLGYVALASFLVDQVVWIFSLSLIALLLLAVIEEGIGVGLSAHGVLGRRVREATGLAASSLDQASVLGSGLARLLLFTALGLVALAPWGVDSSDLMGNLRAAFFGFQVGGVTISLSTIAFGIALFIGGFLITRAIQTWLETRYLPHTGLDLGLRNSIRTIFGYIGVLLTLGVALSQLGFSLEKLTIVAGALSVGIGFGLQSIVNNFVSGLILLWERPIRVGDWIVVGDEQGTVKRINVRATEIETFDRASLIIPNSTFISGKVKNWMHSDRTGRIIIPINVEYSADPEAVQALLKAVALAHREVLSEPGPMVIFKNLGESGLDFELRCFVDVDSMATTRSELLFEIFKRLKADGIAVPYPTRRLEITNLSSLLPQGVDGTPIQLVKDER